MAKTSKMINVTINPDLTKFHESMTRVRQAEAHAKALNALARWLILLGMSRARAYRITIELLDETSAEILDDAGQLRASLIDQGGAGG